MRLGSLPRIVSFALFALAACEREPLEPVSERRDTQRTARSRGAGASEVFAACDGLSDGTACQVTLPGRSYSGTCRPARGDGARRVCVPSGFGARELSSRELERKLDQLEREIQGS